VGEFLRPLLSPVEAALKQWLTDDSVPAPLAEAMRYAALDGGKRIRPALVLLAAEAVADRSAWRADPMPAAVAVEMVHCYSLVHDDLPAMDNDTLRRGRPTCHVQFGEAMAILAGDALLTRAFEVLTLGIADPALAAHLVTELALAAGPAGMVAGQVADMALCPAPRGVAGQEYIHRRKTGAMIGCAVRMGGLCAGANEAQLAALTDFGQSIGLAFQVTDDLLDATASSRELGKTAGKDAQAGKQTYVGALGLEKTAELAGQLTDQALAALRPLGPRGQRLARLAQLLAWRGR
jgi:geranylgeranyl pyrophosphate synthase